MRNAVMDEVAQCGQLAVKFFPPEQGYLSSEDQGALVMKRRLQLTLPNGQTADGIIAVTPERDAMSDEYTELLVLAALRRLWLEAKKEMA